MSQKFNVIETAEGCESFVLATPDYVIRAWLEGEDPDELGGVIVSLSYRADRALRGLLEANFAWSGSRTQFVAALQAFGIDAIGCDPRFRISAVR
ncbi:MAG: hypothetical protein J0H27_14255 [Xanthomonadales bacterium]|nr:hypothetical protein [Xanthomonadales bacterium]ODU93075.1 MAG: hypothetical protein ABT18_09940 [Rhodanobacter sp. SCN 66-43]OJY83756.1 MAG: hypothetical protein BGP23_14070 [Xanthomonadales bacterium 66-474]